MKELELKEKIDVSVKKQKQVEHQLIGKIIPHENHSMWEINNETHEVKKAQYSNTTYQAFAKNQKEIIVKKGFSYVSALNKKNALKQFLKGKNGSK